MAHGYTAVYCMVVNNLRDFALFFLNEFLCTLGGGGEDLLF